MKTKTLAVLMTALSIGVSSIGLTAASAQEDPLIKKKGAPQTEQPGGDATQQPNADQPAQSGDGTQTQPPAAGSNGGTEQGSSTEKTMKPTDQTAPTGADQTAEPDGSKAEGSKQAAPKAADTKSTEGGTSAPATKGDKPQTNDAATPQGQTSGDATADGGNAEGKAKAEGKTESKTETNTTNVNISVKQQTEVRQVIREVHVEPVRETNFTVSVGTTIPRKIRLEPLPPRIIEIVPQYKTYRFFILADGRIVIVNPTEFTIVYIIAA